MCNFFNKKAVFSQNQDVHRYKGLCEICVSWGVFAALSSAILGFYKLTFSQQQGFLDDPKSVDPHFFVVSNLSQGIFSSSNG